MPEISRFYGISIMIYPQDHNPPHFHARYGEEVGVIELNPPHLAQGYLPPKALGLVLEWAELHESELLADWNLMRLGKIPLKIEPLK